ncbi:Uncharacterised protein [Mycobacteroides abscessus]|nr:Uncharacterised protein [Mycobacteroides abscessus]
MSSAVEASGTRANTVLKSSAPNVANMSIIATMRPMSPTRFMTNAFFAATAYARLWFQNPMSRYDARPTPSQPTNSRRNESARTRTSIAAMNRLRYAKNRRRSRSCAM